MKLQIKLGAVLVALLLVAGVSLVHNPKVSAAGNGKITGTVKLDGTPAAHERDRHVEGSLLREVSRQ